LGCGVEFQQPTIITKALALTSTHDKSIGDFLSKTEKYTLGKEVVIKSLVKIISEINADEIRAASLWEEPRKFANGPIQKAEKVMLWRVVQWRVSPGNLDNMAAEILNGAGKQSTLCI
jgi:hypothetical protein